MFNQPETIRFKATEDNCIYQYDVQRDVWQKISDLPPSYILPMSIRVKLQKMQESLMSKTPLSPEEVEEILRARMAKDG